VTDQSSRDVLPIPDRPYEGELPWTPRILRRRSRRSSRCCPRPALQTCSSFCSTTSASRFKCVRRAVRDTDGRAPGRERPQVQPLPHDGAVRPHAVCLADGPQPPHGWDGGHHRARDGGTRLQLGPPEHLRPSGADLQLNGYSTAQFGKCHEVPVWQTSPMGPVRRLADRQRLRILLRLHRR
jgi:hypothetical protein